MSISLKAKIILSALFSGLGILVVCVSGVIIAVKSGASSGLILFELGLGALTTICVMAVTIALLFPDANKVKALIQLVSVSGEVIPKKNSAGDIDTVTNYLTDLSSRYNDLSSATYHSGDDLASIMAEVSMAVVEQTGSTDSQAKAIAETTATVREVRQISQQSADKAMEIVDLSTQAVEVYQEGVDAFNRSNEEITRLDEQVERSVESILNLSDKTQQIGLIVNEVKKLAERSNILALNASIEAARAGEMGRGFGVVATEIKGLADKSKKATVNIQEIIAEIQNATNTSVMVAEEASKRVVSATAMVAILQGKIRELADYLETARQSAKMISTSANQQSIGMKQISVAMSNLDEATKDYLVGNRRTEDATRKLSVIGGDLCELAEKHSR